jgi:apolipoprotein D and lipocalin family protein
MSTQQLPLESLDERIRRAELRLIAREDSLKRRINLLGQRVQDALEPRRYVVPAIGLATASLALWMMRSRRRRVTSPGARARAPAASMLSELPWMHLLPLVWPLLPAGWRDRIKPATVATVVSLGLPLAERLFARRGARRRR